MVGSIIIPDSAKEKPHQGEVIAVGKGRRLSTGECGAIDVKPGDRVLFGKYSGSETKAGEDEYLVLREDEILAVLS
jgi:chaperonin GroES